MRLWHWGEFPSSWSWNMSEFLRFRGDTSTKHADISKIVNIAKAIGICHKRIPRTNSTKMGIKPNNNNECWEMPRIMYCQKSKQKTLNSQVHSVYFVPIHQMGQLSSFPCSFPTKKPCQILPAWLGVGDPNSPPPRPPANSPWPQEPPGPSPPAAGSAAKPAAAAAPAAPCSSRRTRSGASGAVTQGVQRHLWRWTGDGDAMAMAMVKVSFQLWSCLNCDFERGKRGVRGILRPK